MYYQQPIIFVSFNLGSCEIFAEGRMLGAPACSKVQSIYLKVVYACINSEVLKPTYSDASVNASKDSLGNEGDYISPENTQDYYDSIPPSLTTIIPNKKQKTGNGNNNNNNKHSSSIDHGTNENADEDEDGQFDRSYIISSSHGGTREETNFDDINAKGDDNEIKGMSDSEKEVSVVKAKDQSKLKQQSEIVVGLASDILSSYKHITDNTEEFLLFVGLAVALGLGLFLALVVWGMYRSNRLTRIKNRLRKPNSNVMTTSDTTANGTMSDIIDAYVNSPITGNFPTPNLKSILCTK